MSLRVLWLTSRYPNAADEVGGVFVRTQARALVRTGAEVDLIAPVPYLPPFLARLSARGRHFAALPRRQSDRGVNVERPRYITTPRAMRYGVPDRALALAARRCVGRRRYDLVHVHYAYPEGLAGVRLGRALGVPVVLTVHGSDVQRLPLQSRRLYRLVALGVRGADHVLAVSDALAQRTLEVASRPAEVLPIGVDLTRFSALPDRKEARQRLGLPPSGFLVLFVGSLLEAKGVRDLLAAMQAAELRDSVAVFVGDGPLARAVDQSPCAMAVGAVPNEVVPLYLRAADVLALPSYSEGTPTVVVEAGAAELPVVATDVGGTGALLGSERGLLVAPGDVDGLARALVEVRLRPAEAVARASGLRRLIEQEHDADTSARRLLAVYASVLERAGGRLNAPDGAGLG